MNRRIAVVVALIGAAGLMHACAGAMGANRKNPGVLKDGTFTPTRPAAANYGPDPAVTCPTHGVNDAVDSEVRNRLGDKAPKTDGRLCAIADTLLGWPGGDKELPSEPVRSFLSQYFGLPSTVRNILITTLDSNKEADVAAALVDPIASFAANAKAPLYGLITEYASSRGGGGSSRGQAQTGQTRVSLVMYDQTVVIDPLPRQLAPGTTATLSGRITPPAKSPKLQIVDPVGKLEKVNGEGNAFKTQLSCGQKPGRILVAITAEGEGGGEVNAATFPIACGTQLATSVKVPTGPTGPVDPAQAEKQIAGLLNNDRSSAGLKPLAVNDALSKIARDISQKRAAGQGISSADLMNGLKEADIATPLVLESAAQSFGPDEVYSRLSESPQDRANQMRGDITDVGIGVAKGAEVGGRPTIIVTELFVAQGPPPDPGDLKGKIYDAIAKKRSDARKPALSKDATLESVAQKYADASVKAGGDVPREEQNKILAPLYKGSMTVNQLGGFVPNEETALSLAEQPLIVGDAKLIGVGVAVGRSPQFGKNSPFVVVFTGTRHSAKPAAKSSSKRK